MGLTKNAHVVAFPAEDEDLQEDEDDDFQGTFVARYVCTFFCAIYFFFNVLFRYFIKWGGGGGQGGHNLPLPVPRSPASRTFLSLCLPTPALYCVSPVIM